MKGVIPTSGSGEGVWGSENVARMPGACLVRGAGGWVRTAGESRGTEAGRGEGWLGAEGRERGPRAHGSVCTTQLALQSSWEDFKGHHG